MLRGLEFTVNLKFKKDNFYYSEFYFLTQLRLGNDNLHSFPNQVAALSPFRQKKVKWE